MRIFLLSAFQGEHVRDNSCKIAAFGTTINMKFEPEADYGKGSSMNLTEFKGIIKFAMANEVEAQKFYEDAAERLGDPHLKSMFQGFAEEEKRHRDILKGIYISNRIGEYFDEARDYRVSEGIDMPQLSTDMKPAEALALALKKEEEAMVQYTELAKSCPDEAKKQVFLDLAAMERGHKLKMENAFVDIGYPEVW